VREFHRLVLRIGKLGLERLKAISLPVTVVDTTSAYFLLRPPKTAENSRKQQKTVCGNRLSGSQTLTGALAGVNHYLHSISTLS
jgi:hypothetical protein